MLCYFFGLLLDSNFLKTYANCVCSGSWLIMMYAAQYNKRSLRDYDNMLSPSLKVIARSRLSLVALLACLLCYGNGGVAEDDVFYADKCVRVVDGDSLYLDGLPTQIRLWGVDAPERGQAGFAEATSTLRQLALHNNLLCRQVDIDKYKRIVAHCFLASGEDINRLMLESGTAKEYCYFSRGHFGFCDKREPQQ